MAIGFGIVEFIEATVVLAAWHRGNEVKARNSATSTPSSLSRRTLAQ